MKILGIDPGSRHTGYGLVEARGSRLAVLAAGRFSPPRDAGMAPRLAHLAVELAALLEQQQPATVAIESTFHGLNSRSLIVLAQARGALMAEVARREIPLFEYSPAEVKSAVTGSGQASKLQVARMVSLLTGASTSELPADAADAIAIAICCSRRLWTERLQAFQVGRK